ELWNDTRRSRASCPGRSPARCLGGLVCLLAETRILLWSSSVGTVARPLPMGPLVEGLKRFRSLIAGTSSTIWARHHADVKRASTPSEEEHQVIAALDQQALAHIMARSQAEQLRQARRERRLATFTRVQELSATSAGVVLRLPVCLGSIKRPP